MPFRLQYRRYRLPFRMPVRTAHGFWSTREGLLVQLEDDAGNAAVGEAAPIPEFGTESVDEAEAGCRELGNIVDENILERIPERLGCLRHAIAAARAEMSDDSGGPPAGHASDGDASYRAVAALLPAGKAAMSRIEPLAESGFRVFKWKVGVGDLADELALLDDICAALPGGAKLRLDANGAWDRRKAERWLERCAERPIEFVEQPCPAAPRKAISGNSAASRGDDLLLGLAADYPTPIALDESIVGEGDIERWIGAGWPGLFVVKPSLLADVDAALERLTKARATVVFSSALETAVGARDALRAAFRWKGEPRALGFGVWPLFEDARFDGPALAPFIRRDDVERIDPAACWQALG